MCRVRAKHARIPDTSSAKLLPPSTDIKHVLEPEHLEAGNGLKVKQRMKRRQATMKYN
jgi:hypothetical protein